MNHRFLTPALEELTASAEYYESQCEGLGYRFLLEVDSTIRRIKNFPEAWGNASHEYRHCHLVGFPFTVIYDKDLSDGLFDCFRFSSAPDAKVLAGKSLNAVIRYLVG